MRSRGLILGLVVLGLGVSACSSGGTGSLTGSLFVDRCGLDGHNLGSAAAPVGFTLPGDYFIGEPVLDPDKHDPMNRLTIKMLSSRHRPEQADLLIIRIADVRLAAGGLGKGTVLGPSSNVRAALVLHTTCPEAKVELELDGDGVAGRGITFSRFGTSPGTGEGIDPSFTIGFGDRLSATLDVDVVDRRAIALGTPIAVAGHLTGAFDFTVEPDATARAYP